MLHKMTTINCIIFEWLILLFAFKQGNGDSVCNLFVTKTSKSWNGKALNISLDPSKWGTINNDVRSCTVDISFSDFFIVRFMKVNMTNSQNSTSYPNPACFFIYKYEFLVYEDMKPIKTLLCSDVGKIWYIEWPFETAFLRIHFTTYYPRPQENLGELIMDVTSYSSTFWSSKRQPINPTTTHTVNFPNELFTDTCLKYKHEYKIIYNWLTRRSYKTNYRFRIVNATADTAICIDIVCHKHCTNVGFFVQCGMKVDVLIDGEKIMKYDCLSTHGYWCLPPSWTNGHEFIDVVVTSSSSSREDNNTYEVLVSTNSSRPFGIDCVYEQTTTTTSTTTTTRTTTSVATQSPWSQWSPWSTDIVYGKTTPKTNLESKSSDMAKIISPILGGVGFFVVIVSVIAYKTYKKRRNSSPTSLNMPYAPDRINSISNNTTGPREGYQQMPTDIRAYHDRPIPTAPILQTQAVSSRRTQNNQVPSRNLAAQVLRVNNPNQSTSTQSCSTQNSRVHTATRQSPGNSIQTPRVQVPSSNGLNLQNRTTNATAGVLQNSQQLPPPSYNVALDMIIVPSHSQN